MLVRSIYAVALMSVLQSPASAQDAPAAPGNSAATWEKPLPLFPVGPEAKPPDEQSILSIVPGTGLVKGTTSALETIGQPLPSTPGRNRTIESCRNTIISKAKKDGMTEVEAASVGEDKTDRKGEYFAPVRFRITYQQPMMYEVREATMICVVDKNGEIVDTYVPAAGEVP